MELKITIIIAVSVVLYSFFRIINTMLKARLDKQKLENELKLKANFTAMLVHELRNPLNCIIGYSDLLIIKNNEEYVKKSSKIITSTAKSMISLINNMLDIYKFEASRMAINKQAIDLGNCIENSVSLMMPLLEKASLTVERKIEVNSMIMADQRKISQVLNNLLSNAIKFSPIHGIIKVVLTGIIDRGMRFQEVSIYDDGPGVDPEKERFLFNVYAQLEDKKGILPKGTGLGLAVSKLIIETHGGTIGYRRPLEEKGSIFYFRLPDEICNSQ